MTDEKDKNVSVFAIETQSEDESTCDRSVLQTYRRRWIYAAIPLSYPSTFSRLSKLEWLCFPPSNAAVRVLAYIIFSQRKLECAYFCVKAEAHDATNRCDTSPRQVAATNRLVWHVKIIATAALSLRSVARIQTGLNSCDLSQRQTKSKRLVAVALQTRGRVAAICCIVCLGLYCLPAFLGSYEDPYVIIGKVCLRVGYREVFWKEFSRLTWRQLSIQRPLLFWVHVICLHSLPSRVGCSFQGKLFSIFKLLWLVFVRYYLSSLTALENHVISVNCT